MPLTVTLVLDFCFLLGNFFLIDIDTAKELDGNFFPPCRIGDQSAAPQPTQSNGFPPYFTESGGLYTILGHYIIILQINILAYLNDLADQSRSSRGP